MPETEQIQPRYYSKTQAALQIMDAGVNPKDALQITNQTNNIHRNTVINLKKKYARYSLTHPKIIKAAHSQISRILNAEPREVTQQTVDKQGQVVEYIEQIAPTDTNILTAVGMVYDRIDPIKREDTHNINLDMLSMVLLAVKQVEGNEPEVIPDDVA